MSQILLLHGTAQRLPLADQSVHCCVTSPPYFGLRTYAGLEPEPWPAGECVMLPDSPPVRVAAETVCLGNESRIESYVWHTVLWLREAWRVLREDGVLWLNCGDSYTGTGGTALAGSLLMIPHRVVLAAQADGWIVRNDCVWAKAAPMPESVFGWRWQQAACACTTPHRVVSGKQGYASQGHRENDKGFSGTPGTLAAPDCPTCHGTGQTDAVALRQGSWRHTRAHDYVFMLTKQMGYYCNGEAVREPFTSENDSRNSGEYIPKRRRNVGGRADGFTSAQGALTWPIGGRNPRSVLTPAPSHLGLDHFASFPPGLIAPLLRATCPERVCGACGIPWAPVVTREGGTWPQRKAAGAAGAYGFSQATHVPVGGSVTTLHGLAPTCACPAATPPRPGVCLDPFAGSGTTLLVCRALGRTGIGLEASPAYLPLARERLSLDALAAWEGRPGAPVADDYTDLPLFLNHQCPSGHREEPLCPPVHRGS